MEAVAGVEAPEDGEIEDSVRRQTEDGGLFKHCCQTPSGRCLRKG